MLTRACDPVICPIRVFRYSFPLDPETFGLRVGADANRLDITFGVGVTSCFLGSLPAILAVLGYICASMSTRSEGFVFKFSCLS